MTASNMPERLFVIAWAFKVKPGHQQAFERAYGPKGDWVRLFRRGDGYLKTELHRDPTKPGRYITLDFWQSREQYESFKRKAKTAYLEIDAKCEALTEDEQLVGEFGGLQSLRSALPNLSGAALVRGDIAIRPATPSDIPAILQIERNTETAAHWSQSAYAESFGDGGPTRTVLVAEDVNQQVCGFVVGRLMAGECELENIVVPSRNRRLGIGSALLTELLDSARATGCSRIFLEVRESHHAARALYEKLGFTRDGERSAYYSDPVETATLYSLRL